MAAPREVRDLHCDEPARTGAGKILWTRFEEMLSFQEAALAGEDIEGVHDMRVAARRLRASMQLFRDLLPRRGYRASMSDFKRLARALGAVRDLDVTIERLEGDRSGRPPSQVLVLDEMIAELREARVRARDTLTQTLQELEGEDFRRRFLVTLAKETM